MHIGPVDCAAWPSTRWQPRRSESQPQPRVPSALRPWHRPQQIPTSKSAREAPRRVSSRPRCGDRLSRRRAARALSRPQSRRGRVRLPAAQRAALPVASTCGAARSAAQESSRAAADASTTPQAARLRPPPLSNAAPSPPPACAPSTCQAAKRDDDQPSIASQLPPLDRTASVDVLVAGCGPAGLYLAAQLAQRGLSVGLVGARRGLSPTRPRAGATSRPRGSCLVLHAACTPHAPRMRHACAHACPPPPQCRP